MCCDIAQAVNVNVTANSHNWSPSPMYLLLHLLHNWIQPKCFSPTQLSGRPLLYLERAHTHVRLKLEKEGRCTGCRRRRHFLMEEFWLANNTVLSLCKKSVRVCFRRNDRTLYKISRHFLFCLCHVQMVTGSLLPPSHTPPPAPYFLH